MKILASTEQAVTMSSREIAELTGKEVKNVHVDIWNMLTQLYEIKKDGWNFNHHKNQQVTLVDGVIAVIDYRGYVSEFQLDRRHTEILITGYDVVRRAAVIDRWFALESGSAQLQLSEMEMIAAIASNAARNEKRISAVEQDVEQIKQGTIPQGYQGYSYLRATYGLSDAKSRQLVMAWSVPHKKVPHVAPGGQVIQMSVVHEESFEKALNQMTKEAEQRGSQWHHPKMGRFSITDRNSAA
ncbi:Rha family transcriptional regulator [Xenorhabdus griffiniae]|uniref:Rha family transcriptional regulator n=2 Tax=Xenorhabdus griffiniae TaxID=351672 RepID=A0ABY9XE83_9GAMM|nr:Rha family transcriptional regulator [Xenorhabdus griffiniae]MBD1228391.1 Rha family transcriptional regulator [Xenorhabdus griffiniae]MBE8587956.1 Rha family transcriptional regulator [Xenorhabdus griffiniae]WMV71227.1 Rha family transcriptional regulator [Xenorhabdus griffiniae]WNH00903.1 Rha family transcriptional regulator [Xenorhabdus griffiniae]